MSGYHHGDLPRQLLSHAAEMAAATGPEAITLRELARRTGVSHSAPVHHFGTRQGLLTALAAEGFRELNGALSAHAEDIYAMGTAYVTWALDHPGHYAVMWQPRLLNDADEELATVRNRAWTLLSTAVASQLSTTAEESDDHGGQGPDGTRIDAYAAFAIVHGLASIWLSGALPSPPRPAGLAGEVVRRLTFGG